MADRFAHAYLGADERCAGFIPLRYDSAVDRARAVTTAAKRSVSSEVLACLRAQNNGGASPAIAANLAALSEPGTVCVLTGQQVGLFLGPLYTVYKAAAAIVTARALEAETGHRAVPIFWLQTEDHDFAEVATTYVPRSGDEPLALTASGDDDSRVSMAHRTFGEDVTSVLGTLTDALGSLPFAEDTLDQLRRHYHPGAGWVESFAGLLTELLAAHGLLVFNPRAPSCAALTAPIHRSAVGSAGAIADRLLARCEKLSDAGFSAPVHIRPQAPLSFFHPDGDEGPRYRIAPDAGQWTVVGGNRTVSAAEVDDALETRPRRFSTSALLRPVLQDVLLPTAAYVGGPGEIDYFAQIGPVYEAFGLPMPLIVPRARFAVVDRKTRRGLDELKLDPAALARPEAELLDGVACRPEHLPDPESLEQRLLSSLRSEFSGLNPELDKLQSGLQKAAERTVESVERACGKFVDKYRTALNQADTRRVDTIRKLKATLYPLDAPQERIFSLPYFAARHGASTFVDKVVDACTPFNADLEALEP